MTSSAAIEVMARIALDAAHYWGDRPWGWEESGEDVRATFRLTADDMLRALVSEGLVVLRDALEQVGSYWAGDEEEGWEPDISLEPAMLETVGRDEAGAWQYQPWQAVYRLADSPTPQTEVSP